MRRRHRQLTVERLLVRLCRFEVLSDTMRAGIDAREVNVSVDGAEDGAQDSQND